MVDSCAAALRLGRRFGERRLARTPAVAVEFKLFRRCYGLVSDDSKARHFIGFTAAASAGTCRNAAEQITSDSSRLGDERRTLREEIMNCDAYRPGRCDACLPEFSCHDNYFFWSATHGREGKSSCHGDKKFFGRRELHCQAAS
jgi:hypothetical protein